MDNLLTTMIIVHLSLSTSLAFDSQTGCQTLSTPICNMGLELGGFILYITLLELIGDCLRASVSPPAVLTSPLGRVVWFWPLILKSVLSKSVLLTIFWM